MTATVVQVAHQTGISDKEWVRLFPKEVTENYTSSITFIKQLTVVAVSTITYLKNAFPEESYSTETFAGIRLKLLKDRCGDALAQFMSTSMRQAFDAFDRKYVHQLALCFYRGDCSADNLIEYHVFEYSYTPEGVALTINTKNRESAKRTLRCSEEAVRTRTAMLVRSLSLFVWQNCTQELPPNYDLSLRLYYNEDAPEEYQAPGFGPSLEADHLARSAHETLCLGWVETPFHKLIARSFVRDLASDSDKAVASDNLPEMTQDGSEDYNEWPAECSRLRCPCGGTDLDELVTCQYCHTQQHAACFGLLGPTPEHCCAACAAQDQDQDQDQDRTPSCLLLVGLDQRKQECLCIFRRTLALCAVRREVRGDELRARFGLSAASAAKMLRLLQSHSVLPNADTQDLTLPRKINPIRLKLASKHFFRMEDRSDSTVERLLASAEQEAGDPLGSVVGPLGAVSLHAAERPGAGAGAPRAADPEPDPTLRQYREVLAVDERCDQLPLSGDHNPVDVDRMPMRKRKAEEKDGEWKPTKLPKLRSGAKTKKKL